METLIHADDMFQIMTKSLSVYMYVDYSYVHEQYISRSPAGTPNAYLKSRFIYVVQTLLILKARKESFWSTTCIVYWASTIEGRKAS